MSQLLKLESFRYELAVAETLEQIKLLDTKAAAIAEIARKEKLGKEKQDEIGLFRLEIEQKKGAWLDENFPHGGKRGNQYEKVATSNSTRLANIGVTYDESSNARYVSRKIESEPERVKEVVEKLKSDPKKVITPNTVRSELKKLDRIEQVEKVKEQIEQENMSQPDGLFDVIAIDPPWEYSEKGGMSYKDYDPDVTRGATPYPTLTLIELKNLVLPAKDDAVLFLWTTHAFLRDAFELMEYWGFDYKATMVWDKLKMGIGRTIRMQLEFCLLGTRGNPLIMGSDVRDIMTEPRREHSRKPDVFYQTVEKMTFGRRLDYFAREKRDGWEVYGAETGKF